MVSDLNPAIDYPFIRRVGLLNTLTSSFFDYELMINDLSHAELYGLRLAAKPMGTAYPLEIGLYTLADISLEPENRFILTPGIDITAPIIFDQGHGSLRAFIDFSVLLLANNSGLHIDSFFSTGLYNYLITAGLSGSAWDLSYAVSAAYHKGFLAPNLFGNDYSWRRGSLIDTLFADTDYTTGISATPLITTYAELGYAPGPLALRLAYEFNLTGSFGLIGFDGYNPDVLSLSVSWQDDPLEVGLNFRQRGFGYRVAY